MSNTKRHGSIKVSLDGSAHVPPDHVPFEVPAAAEDSVTFPISQLSLICTPIIALSPAPRPYPSLPRSTCTPNIVPTRPHQDPELPTTLYCCPTPRRLVPSPSIFPYPSLPEGDHNILPSDDESVTSVPERVSDASISDSSVISTPGRVDTSVPEGDDTSTSVWRSTRVRTAPVHLIQSMFSRLD